MDKLMLKNAIRLILGGYLYDTDLKGKDEWEKLNGIPDMLRELADDYQKEISNYAESLELDKDNPCQYKQ